MGYDTRKDERAKHVIRLGDVGYMEIRESLIKKDFSVESENPHALSMEFMKKLSEHYRIYERKNTFETDGPTKRSVLVFDVVEPLDRFSRIIVNFSMEGEKKMLCVNITGEFVLRIKEHGFFTDTFTEFYLNNVFPVLRKISDQRAKELNAELENI